MITKITLKIVATTLVIAFQPTYAQSEKTCIAYMEADAVYEESALKLEEFCPSDMVRNAIVLLGPPDNPQVNHNPILEKAECISKLQGLQASRNERYRKAYSGPTSKIDSVMDKLVRIDRIRCRYKFEIAK